MQNVMETNKKKIFDLKPVKIGVCGLKTSFGQFESKKLKKQ